MTISYNEAFRVLNEERIALLRKELRRIATKARGDLDKKEWLVKQALESASS